MSNEQLMWPPDEDPEPTSLRDRLVQLVSEDRTLAAIKLLREHTGLGLRECTAAVRVIRDEIVDL